jgi:hypothetical protein
VCLCTNLKSNHVPESLGHSGRWNILFFEFQVICHSFPIPAAFSIFLAGLKQQRSLYEKNAIQFSGTFVLVNSKSFFPAWNILFSFEFQVISIKMKKVYFRPGDGTENILFCEFRVSHFPAFFYCSGNSPHLT